MMRMILSDLELADDSASVHCHSTVVTTVSKSFTFTLCIFYQAV